MLPGAAIPLTKLRELWIHTGTACNLSCPFCHEGSKPGDTRIENPGAESLLPHLDQAVAMGVETFAFTGGEPLIHKDILRILTHALSLRPCLVLTNGTAPLIRRPHHLQLLRQQKWPLRFRVSIDYADEARHDAGRGLGNFRKALQGLRRLADAGFEVSIARQSDPDEDSRAVNARYRQLLRKQLLSEDIPVLSLPELAQPFAAPERNLLPRDAPAKPTACARSRMLLQRGGALTYLPCPLVDDAPAFELGASLAVACAQKVATTHHRCVVCLTRGVDYIGAQPL
jgi:organic radical activating enzyme